MTSSLLDGQSALPRSVPLFRYTPQRGHFSWREWNPALVRSASDLPQYLILGNLDSSTFRRSTSGWSARWQGTEVDTHFDVEYKPGESQWMVRQTWCGLDGGFSVYSTRIPLDKVVGQALNMVFPRNWDRAAKERFEAKYQVTVIEQPENAYGFFGIPDGALHTIVFPVAARNLRPVRQQLQEIIEASPLTYPISAEAKLVFQAVNYVEGKAPDWTTQEAVAFNQSVLETGLAPHGFPAREVANDGAAAWTLRREVYFLFIGVPFAGLTDFMNRIVSENGPLRAAADPELRFELRPVVMPAAIEMLADSVALWDRARTTRSFLQFTRPGEAKTVPNVDEIVDAERNAPATLAKIESISGDVVATIEEIFQRAMDGATP